jgi:DNA polymerase eta
MSSPRYVSSPPFPSGNAAQRRPAKSKFTYKHLNQLANYSTTTPLRTIAHVDLDAFYAQCEMVRLGVDVETPLCVQQWGSLIAVNYPSRAFGIGRFTTALEARKLCENLICQHVATWKEGEDKWAYHDDAFKNMGCHKVSLDPYRLESRKIMAVFKDFLPEAPLQRIEKAGIDEVFIDLSAHVHSILLDRYPELARLPPYDDPSEFLPWPSESIINWTADNLIDLNTEESEVDDPDWDDISLSIAAEVARDLRKAVWDTLHYTCSAGLARNKMLAKLGSATRKPNGQTIVRNRAIQQFLSTFKFTKIRNLGGKLGDEAVAMFDTDQVSDLLKLPIEQLKRLGDDTGSWLYETIRGHDQSEVNPRTKIKSMLSAKSFRPPINTFEQGVRWLRIFAADIFSRCVEEGVLENKRTPKTINLHHRQGGTTRSKQVPIPQGKTITEHILFDLAKNLLAQVVVDGRAWPCANLSLSVAGFEDAVVGNRNITGFLISAEEMKQIQDRGSLLSESLSEDDDDDDGEHEKARKRQKMDDQGIKRFFSGGPSHQIFSNTATPELETPPSETTTYQEIEGVNICQKCGDPIAEDEKQEHADWHFAKELDKQNRPKVPSLPKPQQTTPHVTSTGKGRGRPASKVKVEKGQRRLMFKNG